MKIDAVKRIAVESIPNAPDWLPDFLTPLNAMTEKLQSALQSNLTIDDNMRAAVKSYNFTHDTELVVANPLKVKPVGVSAIYCSSADVASCNVRYLQTGEIGITVNFDMAHTKPCLIRRASATQSLVSGAAVVAMTGWNTTIFSRGSIISDNGSIFTVTEAGTYHVSLFNTLEAGVTYSEFQALVTDGTTDYPQTWLPAPFTDSPRVNVSAVVKLAAGGTLTAYAKQTNAGAAARTMLGGATGRKIEISRLYNDTVTAADVSLIIWGG